MCIQTSREREYDCKIWDGMVLLQQLAAINLPTFGDVSHYLLRRIMKHKLVYFVTDQYHTGSIKSFERDRRQNATGSLRIKVERRDQKRPKQWAKFLRNDENKNEIVQFLLKDWSQKF